MTTLSLANATLRLLSTCSLSRTVAYPGIDAPIYEEVLRAENPDSAFLALTGTAPADRNHARLWAVRCIEAAVADGVPVVPRNSRALRPGDIQLESMTKTSKSEWTALGEIFALLSGSKQLYPVLSTPESDFTPFRARKGADIVAMVLAREPRLPQMLARDPSITVGQLIPSVLCEIDLALLHGGAASGIKRKMVPLSSLRSEGSSDDLSSGPAQHTPSPCSSEACSSEASAGSAAKRARVEINSQRNDLISDPRRTETAVRNGAWNVPFAKMADFRVASRNAQARTSSWAAVPLPAPQHTASYLHDQPALEDEELLACSAAADPFMMAARNSVTAAALDIGGNGYCCDNNSSNSSSPCNTLSPTCASELSGSDALDWDPMFDSDDTGFHAHEMYDDTGDTLVDEYTRALVLGATTNTGEAGDSSLYLNTELMEQIDEPFAASNNDITTTTTTTTTITANSPPPPPSTNNNNSNFDYNTSGAEISVRELTHFSRDGSIGVVSLRAMPQLLKQLSPCSLVRSIGDLVGPGGALVLPCASSDAFSTMLRLVNCSLEVRDWRIVMSAWDVGSTIHHLIAIVSNAAAESGEPFQMLGPLIKAESEPELLRLLTSFNLR